MKAKMPLNLTNLRRLMKRNYGVSLVLVLCIFAAAVFVSIRFRPSIRDDGFEMFSIPQNTYHLDPKMVNYEMDNREFMTLFQKTFQTSQCDTSGKFQPATATPDEVTALLSWFRLEMQQIHTNYQVVEYKIMEVKRNPDTQTLVFALDAVVYRLPAYHGKHLRMVIASSQRTGGYKMLSARLLGEVSADRIQFSPFEYYDPRAETYAPNDSELTAFSLPSLSTEETERLVQRQQSRAAAPQ